MVSFRSHLAEVAATVATTVAATFRLRSQPRFHPAQPEGCGYKSFAAIALLFGALETGLASDTNAVLTAWLNAQTNLHSWSAGFTQTRTLKALAQPLTAPGHVWFTAPNRFRWELGNPVQTIAVRQPEQMLVIYPRLKRAERYPLTGDAAGPWKDTLALFEAGFPRSRADLESRFKILSVNEANEGYVVALQPKSAAARRLMPQIRITFMANDSSLRATELVFADGSSMRNDFTNSQFNLKLDEQVFNPKLGPEIKIVEPLKKGGL